jgi:heptaprenylglyceryl phosphate synthase
MLEVQKVSDITVNTVAEFIRLDGMDATEERQLSTFLEVAKDYIKNYTGLDDLDEYTDLIIAVYILCQDMFDNRVMYVEGSNINKTVQTILDMHTRNNI